MKNSLLKKTLSIVVSLSLVMAFSLPATALAADNDVDVANNHAAAGAAKAVSDIIIDGVSAPVPFEDLDDNAVVNTAENETWEIPTLWIDDNLQLSTTADDDASNLPALAFFVPEGLTIDGDSFTITLSDSVAELFGDEDLIAFYDDSLGITYILPASILDYFEGASKNAIDAKAAGKKKPSAAASTKPAPAANTKKKTRNLIDIYCSNTVREVLSDSELEYLIDLVINKFEPQAVELLKDSFPAFKEAANKNQIGKQIGMYIYYLKGDQDGITEHEGASNALAYVSGDAVMRNGKAVYCYMIGIDTDDLLVRDANNELVKDASGKYLIERDGTHAATFNNTVVHELFHAFMDDYNRTGMLGAKTTEDGITPGGQFVDEGQKARFSALIYPKWFREGTASAVENVYQFRYISFKMLRAVKGSDSKFDDTYTKLGLLDNYLNATLNGKDLYFDIKYSNSGSPIDTDQSRYVTGYLATLYLAQLAAQKDPNIGSAMKADGTFSGDSNTKLCLGLNSILKRMHNGETLDQVIADISAIDGDPSIYTDTADFTEKFIKGPQNDDETYSGDTASITFTLTYLNYMRSLEKLMEQGKRSFLPNGSILFGFDQDYNIPLVYDPNKQWTSKQFKIIESNAFVESTVPSSVALAGGGKSVLPDAGAQADTTALSAALEIELPLAAKAEAADEPNTATETVEPEPAGEPETASEPEVSLETSPVPEIAPQSVAAPEPVAAAAIEPTLEQAA